MSTRNTAVRTVSPWCTPGTTTKNTEMAEMSVPKMRASARWSKRACGSARMPSEAAPANRHTEARRPK
jgi:hypothetical protein